ncbi:MAG TPA: TlpA disulfide reductase family protein [Bryobacteraceae bacterium]|nr:TlpA disulfide reductase family protein [Bryobacteraceae bacterium]
MAGWKRHGMLAAGARAPEIELRDPAGGTRSLRSLLDQGPVLLAFFKVSCPVCQYTFPFLERIYQGAGDGRAAIQIIGVSQDKAEATREFAEEFGLSFPLLLDEARTGYAASNAFGISSVPSLFLVEPDGTIALGESGFSRRGLSVVGERAGTAPFRSGERVPELRPG